MDLRFPSGELTLAGHLARDAGSEPGTRPRLVICHGFPAGGLEASASGQTYPELADRLASDLGWTVLTFNFRGSGPSEGDFSLAGWADDLRAAIDHLDELDGPGGTYVVGSSAGGAIALWVAADDQRVLGVATLAAPADFSHWAADPEAFLARARAVGVVRDPAFPEDREAWALELKEIRAVAAIDRIAPRPVLLVHGSVDAVVPLTDARALADASEGHAELRVVGDAEHRLRHDPRAVAVLLGWLERQASAGG